MKYLVLVDPTPPKCRELHILGENYAQFEVEALSPLMAGWRFVSNPPKGVVATVVAIAQPGHPFIPWAGLMKNYNPRDKSTKQWEGVFMYELEGKKYKVDFEVCAPDQHAVEIILSALEAHQPTHYELEVGIVNPWDSGSIKCFPTL